MLKHISGNTRKMGVVSTLRIGFVMDDHRSAEKSIRQGCIEGYSLLVGCRKLSDSASLVSDDRASLMLRLFGQLRLKAMILDHIVSRIIYLHVHVMYLHVCITMFSSLSTYFM